MCGDTLQENVEHLDQKPPGTDADQNRDNQAENWIHDGPVERPHQGPRDDDRHRPQHIVADLLQCAFDIQVAFRTPAQHEHGQYIHDQACQADAQYQLPFHLGDGAEAAIGLPEHAADDDAQGQGVDQGCQHFQAAVSVRCAPKRRAGRKSAGPPTPSR